MSKIEFRESDHSYWLGDRQFISVTQLLRKHGLSPHYGHIDPQVLANKAEYGKLIHSEIEVYIKNGTVGFTNKLAEFIKYHQDNLDDARLTVESEFIVYSEKYSVAGTADIVTQMRSIDDKVKMDIIDIKTTVALHHKTVAWQLSLYAYMASKGKVGICSGKVLHFTPSGLKVVEVKLVPQVEIERLLECESNGSIYTEPQDTVGITYLQEYLDTHNSINDIAGRVQSIKQTAQETVYLETKELSDQLAMIQRDRQVQQSLQAEQEQSYIQQCNALAVVRDKKQADSLDNIKKQHESKKAIVDKIELEIKQQNELLYKRLKEAESDYVSTIQNEVNKLNELLDTEFEQEKAKLPAVVKVDIATLYEQEQALQSQINAIQLASANAIASEIELLNNSTKQAQNYLVDLKNNIYNAMVEHSVKTWELPNNALKITLVAPTVTKTIDTDKLKKLYPDIADECSKISERKGSLRITGV